MPETQTELSQQTTGHTLSSVSTFHPVLRSLGFGRRTLWCLVDRGFMTKSGSKTNFACFLQQSLSESSWRVNIQERKEDASFPKFLSLRSISRWDTHPLGSLPYSAGLGAQLVHGLWAGFILSEVCA